MTTNVFLERRMGHIDPPKEVYALFRDNDRPGPIHMLNLVRLRAEAAYPDGRKATGAEAYAAFVEMIREPVYREAVKHRQAAVEDSRLIRHAVLPIGKNFGEVPK